MSAGATRASRRSRRTRFFKAEQPAAVVAAARIGKRRAGLAPPTLVVDERELDEPEIAEQPGDGVGIEHAVRGEADALAAERRAEQQRAAGPQHARELRGGMHVPARVDRIPIAPEADVLEH